VVCAQRVTWIRERGKEEQVEEEKEQKGGSLSYWRRRKGKQLLSN
jgi:hypothetical protein